MYQNKVIVIWNYEFTICHFCSVLLYVIFLDIRFVFAAYALIVIL